MTVSPLEWGLYGTVMHWISYKVQDCTFEHVFDVR